MKAFYVLIATVSMALPAIAGTEVHYNAVDPFSGTLEFTGDDQISNIHLESARLVNVSTMYKVSTPDVCPDDSICSETTTVQTAPAVELRVSYDGPTLSAEEGSGAVDSIYIEPSKVSPEAMQALQSKKSLSAKEASRYFGLQKFNHSVTTAVIDDQKTRYCDAYTDGPGQVCPGTAIAYENIQVNHTTVLPVIR